jgi:hypothetical protein
MSIEVADTNVETAVAKTAILKMTGCRAEPDPLPMLSYAEYIVLPEK